MAETGHRILNSTDLKRFAPGKASRFRTELNVGVTSQAGGLRSKFGARKPEALMRAWVEDNSGIFMCTTASYRLLQSRQRIVCTEKVNPLSARPETLAR